jgi:tetratricopeptide (TPR) repeat protein
MKNFHKVTILVIISGLGGFLLGCELWQRQSIQEEQTIDPEVQAREAAKIQAELERCRAYFEEGELGKAQLVLEQILVKRPDQPEALFYRDKLNTNLYTRVYPGDTLSGIAAYYYGDGGKWWILARANAIQSPDKLSSYHRLRIPWLPACEGGKDEVGRLGKSLFGSSRPTKIVLHPVQDGDSLEALAKKHYGDKKLRFFLADYNGLENPQSLVKGSSLAIPVFPPRKIDRTKKDRETLRRGDLALKHQEYEKACRYYSSVPKNSPYRKEARRSMELCRTKGASYYERLGDEALQNSEPKDACRHWKTALRLDPKRQVVEKKLREAEDLVKALELLPTLPE